MQMNLIQPNNAETFPAPKLGDASFENFLHADKTKPRKKRLRKLASAAIHALPDEARALRGTFTQARTDMQNVKELAAMEEGNETSEIVVGRLDVMKYMIWRYGMATPYQVGDDFAGLPAYLTLREHFGAPTAFTAVQAGSFAVAMALAMGERKAQQWKADAQGLDTVPFKGPIMDDILDSSVNSAPWGVMRHASAERNDKEPIELVSPARAAAMSASYATVNTAFYAGSTSIPGLSSWSAFAVSLAGMYWIKGTANGYQERMAEEHKTTDDLAVNEIKVVV